MVTQRFGAADAKLDPGDAKNVPLEIKESPAQQLIGSIKKTDLVQLKNLLEDKNIAPFVHLTDSEFRKPLSVLATLSDSFLLTRSTAGDGCEFIPNIKIAMLELLLRQGQNFSRATIAPWLDFVNEYYCGEEKEEARKLEDAHLLDFVASNLTGVNVAKLRDKGIVYFAHVNNLKGEQIERNNGGRQAQRLEGWNKEDFLACVVRMTLELLVKERLQGDMPSPRTEVLIAEILSQLNTLYDCISRKIIKNDRFAGNVHWNVLTESILERILLIPDGQEYNIEIGWEGHSLYLSFLRRGDQVIVCIDNAGEKNNEHQREGNFDCYPYVVGCFSRDDSLRKKLKPYLQAVLPIVGDKLTDKNFSLRYHYFNNVRKPHPKDLGLPTRPIQTIGNCVTANITFRQIRSLQGHFNWFKAQESAYAAEFKVLPENKEYVQSLRQKYEQPRRLPQRLLWKYRQKYQEKNGMPLLFEDDKMEFKYFTQPTIYHATNNAHKKISDLKPIAGEITWLCGPAGMGKSSISQKILYDWASGRLWSDEFRWVFRIEYCHLTAHHYPQRDRPYLLAEVINRECFENSLTEQQIYVLQQTLEDKEQQQRILILRDGLDERSGVPPKQLEEAECCLDGLPYHIVSCRAEAAGRSENIYSVHGFTDPESKSDGGVKPVAATIKEYITNYFTRINNANAGTKLIEFIDQHEQLKELAQTPLALELICSAWRHHNVAQIEQPSLAKLFQVILTWLLRRRNKLDPVDTPDKILFDRYQKEVAVLQQLAFDLMLANQTEMNIETIKQVYKIDSDRTVQILKLSVLRLSGDENYKFPHYSFQQFIAARFIVEALRCGPDSLQFKQAARLREYKNEPRFGLVFKFVTEILQEESNKILQTEFEKLMTVQLSRQQAIVSHTVAPNIRFLPRPRDQKANNVSCASNGPVRRRSF